MHLYLTYFYFTKLFIHFEFCFYRAMVFSVSQKRVDTVLVIFLLFFCCYYIVLVLYRFFKFLNFILNLGYLLNKHSSVRYTRAYLQSCAYIIL